MCTLPYVVFQSVSAIVSNWAVGKTG
jgi:hypothetical protein